jgi:N-acetyl-gamma-glutamyl-phosphate reductase
VIDAADIVSVLAVGPSGAGKSLKTNLLAGEILGSANPYAVGGTHRHIPEIRQALAAARGDGVDGAAEGIRISFTPVLVPMSRGILATCSAPLARDVSAAEAREVYEKAYADEQFVHVLPEGQWPQTQSVTGSNAVHVQVTVDEAARRLVAVGAVDNLAKGTAGAAVQCMNLALGLDEGTGLTTIGLAP